jgi:hypothetical protein
VDLTPRGLPKRRGMPRNFTGIRQSRLMKRNNYIKLMIGTYVYKTIGKEDAAGLTLEDGSPCDIFDKAIEIDTSFGTARADIDSALQLISQIEGRLVTSTTEAEFVQILDDIIAVETSFNNIDLTIFEQGESLKNLVDDFVKYMIRQQYEAIQRARKLIHDDRNGKYFIEFPQDVKDTVSAYFPGKVFDNHQPEGFTGF